MWGKQQSAYFTQHTNQAKVHSNSLPAPPTTTQGQAKGYY
jgi:hypothetical protein